MLFWKSPTSIWPWNGPKRSSVMIAMPLAEGESARGNHTAGD